MKKKIDLLNDRSDFVREVLETPPNNVITWGNTFLFVFVLLLLALSWFVKYPDIVNSEIVLTTDNPPIYLSSKIQGKIDTILKKDEENIEEGDWIAVIGSNADLNNIRTLDSILTTIRKVNYHLALMDSIELPILNLGEIQPSYNNLVKAVLTFRHHEIDSNYTIQTQLNALQIQQYNNLISGAKRDKQIAEKELKVAKLDLKRNEKLLEVDAISQKEYELAELAYLQAIRALEDRESQIIQVEYQKVSLLSQGKNLQYSEEEMFLNSELDILETIKLTELAFIEWKKKHVLISTAKGKVNFLDYVTQNQYVDASKKLVSIIPVYGKDDFFGIAKMPILNSGKVSVGQNVNIKLYGYPDKEYGIVLGKIANISEVPNESFYLVKITLEKGLTTTYDKELHFTQNLNGNAEIITEDLRLIERFVYTLTQAFK